MKISAATMLTNHLFPHPPDLGDEFSALSRLVEFVHANGTLLLAIGLSWFLPRRTSALPLLVRLVRRLSSLPWIARLLARSLPPLDRWMFRRSKGKQTLTSVLAGLPVVMVTTRGARSGKARTTPLLPIIDPAYPQRFALIATNFGQERYPSWYFNLKKNPQAECEINGRSQRVLVREAEGAEYDRYWQLAEETFFGYRLYRQRIRTRPIPIMIMEPIVE